MSVILFKLNGVPEDEAQEVRDLLTENHIEFYETTAGNWGISVAAIWLRDNTHMQEARQLIDEYQKDRSIRMRAEYEILKRQGQHETLWDRVSRHPLRTLFYLGAILLITYLVTQPFLALSR